MNDQQVMHALGIDDAYEVDRTLASGPGGVTELVTLDGSTPLIRKRIPTKLARRGVWGTLSECDCARLPRVAATYEMPDEFVVVCDFVPGENLEELVAQRGRLPQKDAFRIVSQLCEATQALHAHGIVHRDISPTNVIVAADGAHLIDLGIARFRSEDVTHDTTQLGTRGFASPEQCGYAQTDARSDVYSLGRILGYLLTGVRPETPDTAEYERVLADANVVSPEARKIVCRASALEPSARYQSAAALAAALEGEKYAAPETAAVVPPTFEPAPRRRSWVKVLLAVMAVVAFVAAVAIILAQTFGRGTPAEKDVDAVTTADEPAVSMPATDDEPAGGNAPASTVADLEIVESGWSVDAQGYVHYAVGLRNNGDATIDNPGYTVTGRNESGRVVFSEEQRVFAVPAGETVYFGALAGNGTAPASVDFSLMNISGDQVKPNMDVPVFSVIDAGVIKGVLDGFSIVGEIRTDHAGDESVGMGEILVVVVFRDENEDIVYGELTFVGRPAEGKSTSFEINVFNDIDYATYEVHAQAW